jgi:hypothetical protein
MPTPTERRIIQERRAAKSGAVLVPIMEELLEQECIPEDTEDFRYMNMLVQARALPRRKGVFSPSMLGSCMRQAYFAKRGVDKHMVANPQTYGYFLKGNFTHFQWQFAMWKAHRKGLLELVTVPIEHEWELLDDLVIAGELTKKAAKEWKYTLNFYEDGTRPGVEVRVVQGDFGGTIDVLPRIKREVYVVDYKGINLIDFQRTVRKGAKVEYRKQIVGYAQNVNDSGFLGKDKVEECLLVAECKAGPVQGTGSPLALHETRVLVEQYQGEMRRRLRTLRWHDGRDELPPPACVSTTHMGYQECAFNRFCTDEVKQAQRERQEKASGTAKQNWKVNRVRG